MFRTALSTFSFISFLFHLKLRIVLLRPVKNWVRIFMWISLNLNFLVGWYYGHIYYVNQTDSWTWEIFPSSSDILLSFIFQRFQTFWNLLPISIVFFSIFLPFIDMNYVNLWMKIIGMCQCMVGHLLIKSKKWSFYLPIFCYKSVWSFMPLLFWIKMVFFDEENTRDISENEVALWFLFGIEVLEMIFIVNY